MSLGMHPQDWLQVGLAGPGIGAVDEYRPTCLWVLQQKRFLSKRIGVDRISVYPRERSASQILAKLFALIALVQLELIVRVRKGAETTQGRRAVGRREPSLFVMTSRPVVTDPM
jgi:hypothetical protein